MPPKGAAAAKKAAATATPKVDKPPPMNKLDVSNFITSLAAAGKTDPAKQQCLDLYKGLARFDGMKAEILAKWKMDKTCKWICNYQQEKTKTVTNSTTILEGFGTKSCALTVKHTC